MTASESGLTLPKDSLDAEDRRQAVLAVEKGEIAHPATRLLEALGDPDWRVRKEAVRIISAQAVRLDMLSSLVTAISQGDNVGLRNAALEVLIALGSDAAQVLLEVLPTAAEGSRRFIIEALVCGGDRRVVPTLIEAVAGADPIIASTALDALATIGGAQAEEAIRRALRSTDPFHRIAAIDGLNRLGAEVTWRELAPLLEDRLVRRVALVALGRCRQSEAVAPLIKALSDKSNHVISAAATALAKLYDGRLEVAQEVRAQARLLLPSVRAALGRLLDSGATDVREAASVILCLAQAQEALPGVVTLAAYDMLPTSALEALIQWGTPAVTALLDIFDRHEATTRILAPALELACIVANRSTIVDPTLKDRIRATLRQANNSTDPDVVLSATRCMEQWAEGSDAPSLVELAQIAPEEIAQTAGHALMALARRSPEHLKDIIQRIPLEGPACPQLLAVVAEVGGERAFEALNSSLSSGDPAIREAAVTGLARLGGSRVAEVVAFSLADESAQVQSAAALALGRLRDESGRPVGTDALIAAIDNDTPGVQVTVAHALGETGDPQAIDALRRIARSRTPGVTVTAIEGLRRLGDCRLEELLIDSLEHEDEEAVKQALLALCEKPDEKTREHLSRALEHEAWDVRRLAAELLGKLADREAIKALRVRRLVETDELVGLAVEQALAALGEVG
jgi:HEAT repeat protein